jgi:Na+/proline symporter/signal transduction histidine kinase
MLETGTILLLSLMYLSLLFAIAYLGDKRADEGRSLISNPYIYALSLAVYCTAWTFYGSVGLFASSGPLFLTIYIGPTLMAAMGWLIIKKILRISKIHRITSIADFISSRYGKSQVLGGLVTVIAVLGIIPYISLQLKAVSTGYLLIQQHPATHGTIHFSDIPVLQDTAFYVALILAAFAILFGTRHLETTERHEGMVAAIAFESIVKLVAFLSVGFFVVYGLHDGIADIFTKARAMPELHRLFSFDTHNISYADWFCYTFLSMMAIIFLPRQFQVTVVENVNEDHLDKALWLFPLYMLVINIFVIPIALAGILQFPGGKFDADTFVLSLPMAGNQQGLALFVFIGGMSAATGMVIVETVALSTMICNDLLMPIILRLPFSSIDHSQDLSRLLLSIRRGSIIVVLLLGYAYFRFIGEFYTLVSIGMISFAAIAQFAPAMLGGIFWKGANRTGAFYGLLAGFSVWGYTLILPALVQAGILGESLVTDGPFGMAFLKPFELFGLQGFGHVPHAVFWSMLANISFYIGGSLFSRASTIEQTQAALFVDVFKFSELSAGSVIPRGTASSLELKSLLERFLGKNRARKAIREYRQVQGVEWDKSPIANVQMVSHAESLLARAIGTSSAHVVIGTIITEEPIRIEKVMEVLDETRKAITYSRDLEKATAELKAANERLEELDRLKDDFISTVTHELRTPLTSVRSLAEILHATPSLSNEKHKQFTAIIIKESERLTRLIGQVLDIQKIVSEKMQWHLAHVNIRHVILEAVESTRRLIDEKKIVLSLDLADYLPTIYGDHDRLIQVMVNLISNAVKFCPPDNGLLSISLRSAKGNIRVDVKDNGLGINKRDQEIIFDKFQQVKSSSTGRPAGSGLGLNITKHIVEFHKGRIWVKSRLAKGSTFSFTFPKNQSLEDLQTPYGV